jgi:NAD-dependent SIR2 family protein deacetylase
VPSKFSSGKYAIAECDRCGQRYKLKQLRKLIVKQQIYNIKVCPTCWDPDQPQLSLGLYPVNDPQAVRDPRPDISYVNSGLNGLQLTETITTNVDSSGQVSGGSRTIQWGWNPVGGASSFDSVLTPNNLIAVGQVGTVTVT